MVSAMAAACMSNHALFKVNVIGCELDLYVSNFPSPKHLYKVTFASARYPLWQQVEVCSKNTSLAS